MINVLKLYIFFLKKRFYKNVNKIKNYQEVNDKIIGASSIKLVKLLDGNRR